MFIVRCLCLLFVLVCCVLFVAVCVFGSLLLFAIRRLLIDGGCLLFVVCG